jgi:hypothetical protein
LSNPILFPKLGSEAQANLFEALRPDPAVFQGRLLADRANLIIPASPGFTLTKPKPAPTGRWLLSTAPSPRRRYPLAQRRNLLHTRHSLECPGFVALYLFHFASTVSKIHLLPERDSTWSEGLTQ